MFKIGDEIVCIDDSTCGGYIVEGNTYTVVDADENEIVDSTLISVTEVGKEYCSWFANRFVLASEYNKEAVKEEYNVECVKPVVSDGGSSEYYKLTIIRASDGTEFVCEVGDVIAALVGDNFQLGNVVKGARRMWCDAQGKGKDGIDMSYDRNKIHYFSDDFVNRYGKK